MNDEQLLNALRDGQGGAFQELVAAHQHNVINICYRFVRNTADAEDLAQETFVEVYSSIGGFRGMSSLATWIHRIAVSKSLDFVRKQSRQKRGGGLRAILHLDGKAADIPAPEWTAPDRVLEEKERLGALVDALAALPKKQHIALVLSTYDGLTYQEIADTLGTSVAAVESLIHRARENLRKKLRVHYERNVKKR